MATKGSGAWADMPRAMGHARKQAYWPIENSWSEEWDDGGHFKIACGTNECGSESGVSAGRVTESTDAGGIPAELAEH